MTPIRCPRCAGRGTILMDVLADGSDVFGIPRYVPVRGRCTLCHGAGELYPPPRFPRHVGRARVPD